ncbi:MAG: plasmid stabilization protein ParE [Gammaproteobacteria bacterium RIFCSPLOWO2_02_FULL_56_15]|nr:MAG: plasmid stabilization protein ParE [Gammaproteobacteria bacterium RIFCSPLOWO2_02_FULL_56_15]
MKPFALTNEAKADLKAIARFTEKRWGREQRNLYIKQFDDAFHLQAATPLMGKACDYIKTGYRKFPQGSHILFYKAGVVSKIEIVRIHHKNMDVDSKFGNP